MLIYNKTVLENTYSMMWDPVFHHLCCNGHIINLSAQSFLFPDISGINEIDILNTDIQGQLPTQFTEKEMHYWRKKGPLGKIHNIAVYIQHSTQRLADFKAETGGVGLGRDNSTQWNSWYRLLEHAIRYKEAIDIYCFKNKAALLYDTLSESDWDNLSTLIVYLKAYSDATLACESRYATIELILPIMEFLLDTLEKGKTQNTANSFIGLRCQAG
jgi:hypothetical protein